MRFIESDSGDGAGSTYAVAGDVDVFFEDSAAFLEQLNHPVITRPQEGIIFSIGQPKEAGVVPRTTIPTHYLRNMPEYDTFLGYYSGEDLQRTGQLLSDSESLGDYIHRHYLRLVVKNARVFKDKGVPFIDLVQDGRMGLIRAVDRYDIHRVSRHTGEPAAFTSYAVPAMDNAMRDSLKRRWQGSGVPYHIAHAAGLFRKMTEALTIDLGRTPTKAEVLEHATQQDVFAPEILEYLLREASTLVEPQSLNQPIDLDGMELQDVLPSPENTERSALANLAEDFHALLAAMQELPEELKTTLMLHQGLDGNQRLTFREIAEKDGVSRETVRRRECLAIARIRYTMLTNAGIPQREKPNGGIYQNDKEIYRSPFRNERKVADRRERIALLFSQGNNRSEIAAIMGVPVHLVANDLVVLRKINRIPPLPSREERAANVEKLINEGRNAKQIAVRTNTPIRRANSLIRAAELMRHNPTAFNAFLERAEKRNRTE